MSEISDEKLMSYIDGELDWAERRVVESAIHRQPELQERLRVFAATGLNLQRLYSLPMQEAVPEHLLHFVLEQPISHGARGRHEGGRLGIVADLMESLRQALAPGGFRPAMGVALSVVFVFGAVGGLLAGGSSRSKAPVREGVIPVAVGPNMVSYSNGVITAQGQFAQALEASAMDTSTSWSVGGGQEASFRAKFTFVNDRRQFCRQYEITDGGNLGAAGVACRGDLGQWMVVHNVPGVEKSSSGAVMPARGPIQAIDAIVDRMIVGDVLGRADEAARIKSKWERAPAKSQ
jgi:surface antigen